MERLINRKTKLVKGGPEPSMLDVVHKLAEYEDLEEQGLLLKLPCKVGDTVYQINKGAKNPLISMEVHEISLFYLRTKALVMQIKCHDDIDSGEIYYLIDDFGKTVFLTQIEAEEALRKMNEKEESVWE